MAEDEDVLDFLFQLREGKLTSDLHQGSKEFVCKMYGHKVIQNVYKLHANFIWILAS